MGLSPRLWDLTHQLPASKWKNGDLAVSMVQKKTLDLQTLKVTVGGRRGALLSNAVKADGRCNSYQLGGFKTPVCCARKIIAG
ncbi:MAG: hypothetical protein ABJA66_21860 [Actinomycetota bacterium]